jgi:flagellar biosynthesis activator protein FlaF
VYSSPLQAYETVDKTTMSGREIEAAVLTKAACKLRECQQNWHSKNREQKLSEALKYNQLIWSIFQGELKKDDNPLNSQLRANLLQLSALVDRQIFETMGDPSPEKLDMVIEINNNIAAGLRERPGLAR